MTARKTKEKPALAIVKHGELPAKHSSPFPCPAHLTVVAANEWARVVVMLESAGLLSQVSAATMERYCVNYGRWREAEEHVQEHGSVVPAPRTGVPMQNPYLSIANNAGAVVDKLAVEMGLTPNSATRISGKSGAAGGKKHKNAHYFDR